MIKVRPKVDSDYENMFLPCIVCGSYTPLPQIHFGDSPSDFFVHEGNCFEKIKQIQELVSSIGDKISLFFGAGISIPQGIPGTKVFLKKLYGRNVTVKEFSRDLLTNRTLRQKAKTLFTNYHSKATPNIAHLISSRLMVRDLLNSIITTNWDLLLELAIEEQIYALTASRFAIGESNKMLQTSASLPKLSGYQIVEDMGSLKNMSASKLPIFKIHGSPLLYSCPKCSGLKKYKLVPKDTIFDGLLRCSLHPEIDLLSKTILPGEELDLADKNVFEAIKDYLGRASIIIIVGYSGRDSYILSDLLIPNKNKLWIIKKERRNEPIELITDRKRIIHLNAIRFFRCFEALINMREINPIAFPHEQNIVQFLKFKASIDLGGYEEVKPYYERLFTREQIIKDIQNKCSKQAAFVYSLPLI